MSVFLLAAPHLSSSLHCKLHFNRQSEVNRRYIVFTSHLNPKPTTIVSSLQNGSAKPSVPLQSLKPYLLSEYRPILAGWLFSAISVASLSKLVPKFSLTITTFDIQLLKSDGLVLGILVLSRLVSNYFQQALLWDAALNAMYKARLHVFGRVLDRDMGFFEGRNGVSSGDIAYRITAEAADVADAIYSLLNAVVPSTLQLSAMAVQMLAISPALSLVSALVIPCLALVIAYLGKRQRMIAKKANLSIAALSSYLNEVLPAILFVKANNTEPCEIARFKRLAYVDRSARLNKRKMKAVIPQIIQSIYIGALFIICAGSLLISEGSFNGCRMVSFITSLVLLIEPIQAVGKAYNELKEAEPAIERLLDLSRAKAKVMERPDAVHLDHVAGDVKFCDVSFKYGDDMPLVLDRIDLQIRAGETAALVGPSGGGKTTLAKLLLRLYDPSAGSIHIDNHNIQNIQLETLRRRVCLVSQDIALFSGTVAENIGYRDLMTGIQMERVEFAGKFANADEFIKMLPNGYQTNIGPRGSILSGGQKQRLAIARAVYQDPAILILDEATSALDSRSELLVRQALQRLMESRTVLVIAHRLETVLMAKRIFSLDDGKLQEITRSSLLREGRDTLASERLVI